jgi:antitoxin ParD1/3/4
MQIALSESQEEFVKQAVSEGRFASEAEVLDAGFRLVQAREQKLDELRAMINASLAEGGAFTTEEMDADLEAETRQLLAEGIPW